MPTRRLTSSTQTIVPYSSFEWIFFEYWVRFKWFQTAKGFFNQKLFLKIKKWQVVSPLSCHSLKSTCWSKLSSLCSLWILEYYTVYSIRNKWLCLKSTIRCLNRTDTKGSLFVSQWHSCTDFTATEEGQNNLLYSCRTCLCWQYLLIHLIPCEEFCISFS